MQRIALATAALIAGLAFASPGIAQDQNEHVNQLIVYGDDPCPKATDPNEITVCFRKGESERYRIPEPLRESQSPQNDAWNNRVLAYEVVGKTGILSCTPVGPGGSTGCLSKLIDNAYAEKATSSEVKFSELIATERAKRLATIDAEAAETQARVEEQEKLYEARQRAQQEASDKGGSADGQ